MISAEYLPGIQNKVAGEESQSLQTSAEWKLCSDVFQTVLTTLDPRAVDFFCHPPQPPTTQLCELPVCRCFQSQLEGYAFPPFSLLGKLEDTGGEQHCSSGNPSLASADMVPSSPGAGGGGPITTTKES